MDIIGWIKYFFLRNGAEEVMSALRKGDTAIIQYYAGYPGLFSRFCYLKGKVIDSWQMLEGFDRDLNPRQVLPEDVPDVLAATDAYAPIEAWGDEIVCVEIESVSGDILGEKHWHGALKNDVRYFLVSRFASGAKPGFVNHAYCVQLHPRENITLSDCMGFDNDHIYIIQKH